jgi:hypothetical protein
MKMTKQDLKNLMKECLRELIAEGAFSKALLETNKKQGNGVAQPTGIYTLPPTNSNDGLINNNNNNNEEQINPNLIRTIKAASSLITRGDPKQSKIMENILLDTATTTLQKQLAGEGQGGGIPATPEETRADETQLKMLGAQNWARLAFNDKQIK